VSESCSNCRYRHADKVCPLPEPRITHCGKWKPDMEKENDARMAKMKERKEERNRT
jgi:hypothetical protein